MLPLTQALIKTKKWPSFSPIGQKMLILHENLEFLMVREKGDQSIWSGFSIGYKMVRFE